MSLALFILVRLLTPLTAFALVALVSACQFQNDTMFELDVTQAAACNNPAAAAAGCDSPQLVTAGSTYTVDGATVEIATGHCNFLSCGADEGANSSPASCASYCQTAAPAPGCAAGLLENGTCTCLACYRE